MNHPLFNQNFFYHNELLSFLHFSDVYLIKKIHFTSSICAFITAGSKFHLLTKMSKVILYHWDCSPFSRAVLQLCRYIKVDVEVKHLDLFKGEHMTEEYLAVNPMHTVPFIIDGDFKLGESKAILQYLMESRAPHLIAASPKERATISQRMMFEEGKVCAGYFKIVVSHRVAI